MPAPGIPGRCSASQASQSVSLASSLWYAHGRSGWEPGQRFRGAGSVDQIERRSLRLGALLQLISWDF